MPADYSDLSCGGLCIDPSCLLSKPGCWYEFLNSHKQPEIKCCIHWVDIIELTCRIFFSQQWVWNAHLKSNSASDRGFLWLLLNVFMKQLHIFSVHQQHLLHLWKFNTDANSSWHYPSMTLRWSKSCFFWDQKWPYLLKGWGEYLNWFWLRTQGHATMTILNRKNWILMVIVIATSRPLLTLRTNGGWKHFHIAFTSHTQKPCPCCRVNGLI